MKAILVAALLLTSSAVGEPPIDVFPNGCVIACVEFQANLSLARHGVWSRVVKINLDNNTSHAVLVFALQDDALAVYDVNSGTSRLGISQRDLASITIALKYQYLHMTAATFLD